MGVRCKFYCSEVARTKHYQGSGQIDAERVKLHAVYGDSDENKTWSKATPTGTFEFTITNPDAMGKFEPGSCYFIDLAPVS